MKRYCVKCTAHAEVKLDDRRRNEVCVTCGSLDVHFTLRQRRWFLNYFKKDGSAEVRSVMFSRHSGHTGTIVELWDYGLHLDFFGPAPSIEAWEWDELEIAHLLPEDEPEIDRSVTTELSRFRLGDQVMLKNGKVYYFNRHIRTRDKTAKFGIAGIDIYGGENIGAKNVHRVVDWLPRDERGGTQWTT